MKLKEAKEDLKTLKEFFEEKSEGSYPEVLRYCFYLLSAIENNDKILMEMLVKGEYK